MFRTRERKFVDERKVPQSFRLTMTAFDQVTVLSKLPEFEGNKSHVLRAAVDEYYTKRFGDEVLTWQTKACVEVIKPDASCDPAALDKLKT
jgi:hypothetical protein